MMDDADAGSVESANNSCLLAVPAVRYLIHYLKRGRKARERERERERDNSGNVLATTVDKNHLLEITAGKYMYFAAVDHDCDAMTNNSNISNNRPRDQAEAGMSNRTKHNRSPFLVSFFSISQRPQIIRFRI